MPRRGNVLQTQRIGDSQVHAVVALADGPFVVEQALRYLVSPTRVEGWWSPEGLYDFGGSPAYPG